jgi:hypothetical protein
MCKALRDSHCPLFVSSGEERKSRYELREIFKIAKLFRLVKLVDFV